MADAATAPEDTGESEPEVVNSISSVAAPDDLAPPAAAPREPALTVEVDRTSTTGRGSLTPDRPAAPVDSPLDVVALAVATRLRAAELSASTDSGNPTVSTLSVDETPDTTTTFGVAAPNSAPTDQVVPAAAPANSAPSTAVSDAPSQYAATTSFATGPGPSAVTVGSDGRLYVANTASWSVSVIDTATGQRIDANTANPSAVDVQVGAWPGALLLSPDGKRLFVANTGWMTVSVIDTTTYKAIDADHLSMAARALQ